MINQSVFVEYLLCASIFSKFHIIMDTLEYEHVPESVYAHIFTYLIAECIKMFYPADVGGHA